MSFDPHFIDKLLGWFDIHSRDLPWRHTYAPYQVWISEIMLQQTQMDRVVFYFTRWLDRFPDIISLAAADEDEVLKYWEGLGYYSRARNLHRTAKLLTEQGNMLPDCYESLIKLPGIGPYTAGAIMSIAFNQDFPVVDANVERLFARLFDIATPIKNRENKTLVWQKAAEMLPVGKSRMFNQALMELGALVCLPKNPLCSQCPVSDYCKAHQLQIVSERPMLLPKKKTIFIEMATGILVRGDKILIQKRQADDVWANLWEFPGGRLKEGEMPQQAVVREFLEETGLHVGVTGEITSVRHSYMHYRVILHGFFCEVMDGEEQEPALHAAQENRWVYFTELHRFAFPAGHRKLIDYLRNSSGI
ncbi:MAG: A/G-specific adenine glycosylase [Proteobacteria bacterium]|nr:A/G-specific adenine glycosylase [Pseudomonadota bacterium]MBU0965959.1 A/G-specific adenine glycosylase [Pseudomonadota bacterium]